MSAFAGEQPRWLAAVAREGFAFVPAADMRALLLQHGGLSDWDAFRDSWNTLGPDPYLAVHGRLRRRRHAVFAGSREGPISRQPHQPHYQALDYNALQGGIERWFEPVEDAVSHGATLACVLAAARGLFSGLSPDVGAWRIEVHQFRIEASAAQAGEPTPEGVHRDGVDHVLVLLVDRQNIDSGTTTIHDAAGRTLGSFTLTLPLDAAVVDDHRVFHGVTPVRPLDPAAPAHRDVLVVTFRATT